MKQELIEEMNGYNEAIQELEISQKFGSDMMTTRGEVSAFVNKLHPEKIKLKVSRIIDETPSTKTFRLVSLDGYLPPFQAGQYITLFIETDGIKTGRPYSISSPPGHIAYYDITVKRVENGLVSNFLLDEVRVGDIVYSSGPAGNFYYNPIIHDKTLIFIAGGSGITPFKSMIQEITESGLDLTVYLFYGNKNEDDIIFDNDLKGMADSFDNIHYIPVIESPSPKIKCEQGLITADLLLKILKTIENKSFFICGSRGMYEFCLPEIESMNVPGRKIRKEMFGSPVHIWEEQGWPQEIDKDIKISITVKGNKEGSFKMKVSENILSALEMNKFLIPSLCRSGECSMCRIKLNSGAVFQPQGTPVRYADRKSGYIHACVSYPLEDCEILI